MVVFTPYISDILNKLMEMSKYGHYLDSIFADREQGYIALFISIMVAVFGYFFNNKTDKKYQLYLKMQVIAIWISILVPYVPLINRIKSYFGLHVIIFIPLVLNKIKDQATRYAAMWVIIILYSVYCIYNLVVHNTNNVLPYHTIFELKF